MGSGGMQISPDGKNWCNVEATEGSSCRAVPPASYVKLNGSKGLYQVSHRIWSWPGNFRSRATRRQAGLR